MLTLNEMKAMRDAEIATVKALVVACEVSATDALVRVDAVLARKSLTDGKKARWTRLREWLVSRDMNDAANCNPDYNDFYDGNGYPRPSERI
jgi:hypothetical protein